MKPLGVLFRCMNTGWNTLFVLNIYHQSIPVGADPLSSDLWNPGPHGFGGNGNGSFSCVDTGPFREGLWSLIESAGGGCLRRQFRLATY